MDINSSVNFNDDRPCSSGKQRSVDIHSCGDTEWLPILIPMNSFIFIMGVFPNILVVYLIYSRKLLRERYIMNASVSASHILFCVLMPPLVIVYHVTSNPTTSRACEFVVCCVVSVTSLTMAVIAARRALALSETFRYKLGEFTFKSKLLAKLIIWTSSIGIAVPLTLDACVALSPFSMITYRVSEIGANSGNNNKSFCCTNRTVGDVLLRSSGDIPCHAYSVTIATLLIYVICPASLILTGYGYRCITQRPNQKLWKKELMLSKQHLVMIIIFIVCWTPITIINLLRDKEGMSCGLQFAFQLVAMVTVLDSPVLYYIFNQHMKQEFKKWIKRVLSNA